MVALRLRHVFLTLGIAAVMLLMHVQLALPASAQTSTYQNDCGCVHFVQHYLLDHGMTPLAGGVNTASGYTEGFMRSIGYYRVKPTNDPVNNYIPADGAVMVWDAGQKGAYDAGHMAIVQGNPYYDYGSQKWIITVVQDDWSDGNGPQCGPLGKQTTFTGWGDLYGINFYKPFGQ